MNRMHENYNEETMVYRIEQYKKKARHRFGTLTAHITNIRTQAHRQAQTQSQSHTLHTGTYTDTK